MEVIEMRRQLRDIMGQAQTRYSLPVLGPKYLKLYGKAKDLLGRRSIESSEFTAQYAAIVNQFKELETQVDPDAGKPAAEEPQQPVKKKRGGSRPGAGRKRQGQGRNLTLNLPPGYWETIDAWMERTGQTNLTGLIRSLVVALVDQLEINNSIDEVDCPVCSGSGSIQPKGEPVVCPGCEGEKKLRQLKVKI